MFVFYTSMIDQSNLLLEGDEARHCIKTLRHKEGDIIQVFDESGFLYESRIEEIKRNQVVCSILDTKDPQKSNCQITMAVAPTKSPDRLEWMCSKAVEIGVQEMIIMQTDHTERSRYKMDRLHRIMISAAKQSLNLKLPIIRELSFEETLQAYDSVDVKLIAHCEEPEHHLIKLDTMSAKSICFLIGPEGDFSKREIEMAKANQWDEISLGKSRLRTETAAIVALTILNAKMFSQGIS